MWGEMPGGVALLYVHVHMHTCSVMAPTYVYLTTIRLGNEANKSRRCHALVQVVSGGQAVLCGGWIVPSTRIYGNLCFAFS